MGIEFISGGREKKGSSVRKGLCRVRTGWPAHHERREQKQLPRRMEAGSSRLSFLAQPVLCCPGDRGPACPGMSRALGEPEQNVL